MQKEWFACLLSLCDAACRGHVVALVATQRLTRTLTVCNRVLKGCETMKSVMRSLGVLSNSLLANAITATGRIGDARTKPSRERRSSQVLTGPERLESRTLFAVTAIVRDGLLDIAGDNFANTIIVRPGSAANGGFSVDGVNLQVINRTPVTRIQVNAFQGDDFIDIGLVNVPATIYAGKGNDTVQGSMANDIIFAGFGNDTVNGRAGNDTIYLGPDNDRGLGGQGNDVIFGEDGDDWIGGQLGSDSLDGGNGNDALFGGIADGQDTLRGGAGSDRYLIPTGSSMDQVMDLANEDARVYFANSAAISGMQFLGQQGTFSFSAGSWDNHLIERVDEALGNLHRHTGNGRLLKTANRSEITFLAVGAQTSGLSGIGGWNSGTTIAFVNPNAIQPSWLLRTVYHEIGHNFDQPHENRFVSNFRAVSGWVESDTTGPGYTASAGFGDRWQYLTSATSTFARSYGLTNPLEDLATTWEAYFVNAFHGGSSGLAREGLIGNAAKWATLDQLFAELRSFA